MSRLFFSFALFVLALGDAYMLGRDSGDTFHALVAWLGMVFCGAGSIMSAFAAGIEIEKATK